MWALCISLAAAVAACVPPPSAPVTVQTTLAPTDQAVVAAREVLGPRVVDVAEAAVTVADAHHAVRFEVPRGAPQQAAAAQLAEQLHAMLAAAAALTEVAETVEGPRVGPARAAAHELSEVAEDLAAAIAEDLDALHPYAEFDRRLDELVQRWDEPGTRSERAEALAALVADAEAAERGARRLPVARCVDLRADRVRWAELVVERTAQLRDAATVRDGTTFDRLRRRFSNAPYGEDRVAADLERQACLSASSAVQDLSSQVEPLVAAVEAALN